MTEYAVRFAHYEMVWSAIEDRNGSIEDNIATIILFFVVDIFGMVSFAPILIIRREKAMVHSAEA